MMRVANYIAQFIYEQGVRHIFMMSGGGSLYLDDGIAKHGILNSIGVRNEATAPMMAEAYARMNNNLGVVYVTTGPGGANAVAGVAEAWVDSAPILIISGQVERDLTSYNLNMKVRTLGTQELNIIEVAKSITKYAKMVNDPNSIRYHLEKAVWFATHGRKGPVWLDIPTDVQCSEIDENKLKGYSTDYSIKLNPISIYNITKFLSESKKPVLIAGQGIRLGKCIPKFEKLIDRLNIPVVFSRLGNDLIPFSSKNHFGHAGSKANKLANDILKESDLILSLGSRLSVPMIQLNRDTFYGKTRLIAVDIDISELTKHTIKPSLIVHADVKDVIDALCVYYEKNKVIYYDDWMKHCTEYKNSYNIVTKDLQRNPIDLYYFISRLDALSTEDHIFVSDAGSSYYVTGQVLRFEKCRREITSGAFAAMGLSVPLAIGCAMSDITKQILAITGDGSIETNIQELKTISENKLNIKLFVINNGGYVSIRNLQDDICEGRHINSEIKGLNFKKIADAFDLRYFKIEHYEEVDVFLKMIMSDNNPILVEVVCDNNQKIRQ